MKDKINFIYILLTLSLLLMVNNILADDNSATVTILSKEPMLDSVSSMHFGCGLEFARHFINGPVGLHAQELLNRGFDFSACDTTGASCRWQAYANTNIKYNIQLLNGGYNENGLYFQRLFKQDTSGEIGLYQWIVFPKDTSAEFYIYARGNSSAGNIIISLRDSSLTKIYYSAELGIPSNDWQKFSIIVPQISNATIGMLVISMKGQDTLDLDESSFMLLNNINGIRPEYYKFFKTWSPGMMRYPGGCFAEFPNAQLESAIGDINQRKSPINEFDFTSERMDFGLDDFITLCKDIGAEPEITVNFSNGSPQTGANYVEYCNGSVDTKFGALRAKYGHPEPYNVKYWEIGNEQYGAWAGGNGRHDSMAYKYLIYYKLMKAVDSTINIIIDGSLWNGYSYFDTIMTIAGTNCQYYGWHHGSDIDTDRIAIDTLMLMGHFRGNDGVDDFATDAEQWLIDFGLYPEVKQGITEYYTVYKNHSDGETRQYTFMTGLWMADLMNTFLKHTSCLRFCEYAFMTGTMYGGIDSIYHQRVFFTSPGFEAINIYRHHCGVKTVMTNVDCGTYFIPHIDGLAWYVVHDPKILNVTSTINDDSIYISIVNRSSYINCLVNLNTDFTPTSNLAKLYRLNSEHLLDSNTCNNPNNVVPTESDWEVKDTITIPAHSFTILAIPAHFTNSVKPNENIQSGITVSPNPFKDKVNFIFPSALTQSEEIKIYDVLGNIVFQDELSSGLNNYTYSNNKLQTGIYFVKFIFGHDSKFIKIIKY